MPSVLVGVNFPPFFQNLTNVFGIVNLDILSLSTALGCNMSVRFFDRFIIHLMLPVFCLLAIGLAFGTVRLCISKKHVHKRILINEAVSKVSVLVILLLFPGLSTKLFSMFKCKTINGVQDALLLVQDYSVSCNEGEHIVFTAIAILFLVLCKFFVFLYFFLILKFHFSSIFSHFLIFHFFLPRFFFTLKDIAGIPFIMFFSLWWNKNHLHDKNSKKHHMVKNALGGFYMQYEPEYWWFELVILLNKTIMCGGLVVLSPGSPSQVLCAVLIMLFHLLVVLRLAPYMKDSEDVSSFVSSLGLTLIYIGALMKMLEDMKGFDEKYNKESMSYIGMVLDTIPVLCVLSVIGIMVFMDCGVYQRVCGGRKKK